LIKIGFYGWQPLTERLVHEAGNRTPFSKKEEWGFCLGMDEKRIEEIGNFGKRKE